MNPTKKLAPKTPMKKASCERLDDCALEMGRQQAMHYWLVKEEKVE
jgi:hypothetical protein